MTNLPEIWVQSIENNYEVSSWGNIRNSKTKKNRRLCVGSHGYYCVTFSNRSTRTLHRLIAIAFIPNPENLEQVNHKDGNKLNNNIENLEWVTRSDNAKHSFKLGMSYQPKSKKILAYNANGRKINFNSIFEAAKYLFIRRASIQDYLSGKRKTSVNGYIFEKIN